MRSGYGGLLQLLLNARLPPGFRRQQFELCKVGQVGVARRFRMGVSRLQEVVHISQQDEADGVDGIVPVEALGHEPPQCPCYRNFVAKCDLVLDDGVRHGVRLHTGDLDPRENVVLPRQSNSLFLVECKPLLRIGSLEGIIALHGLDQSSM